MDVDVARPQLQRAEEDVVDEPDDGRPVHNVQQVVRGGHLVDQLVEVLRVQLLGDLFNDGVSLLVGGIDDGRDRGPRRQRRRDRHVGHFRDVVQDIRIQRPRQDHRQLAVVLLGLDADQVMMLSVHGRDGLNELPGDRLVGNLRQVLPAERLGKQLEDHVFREIGTREQDLIESAPALALLDDLGQPLGVDQPRPLRCLYQQVLHITRFFP